MHWKSQRLPGRWLLYLPVTTTKTEHDAGGVDGDCSDVEDTPTFRNHLIGCVAACYPTRDIVIFSPYESIFVKSVQSTLYD